MICVNIYLLVQTRAENRRKMGIGVTVSFRKENLVLGIVLFFFSLSYLVRFIWDEFLFEHFNGSGEMFGIFLGYDIVYYIDGMTFLALLLLHRNNFKAKIDDYELPITERSSSEALIYLIPNSNLSSSVKSSESNSSKSFMHFAMLPPSEKKEQTVLLEPKH